MSITPATPRLPALSIQIHAIQASVGISCVSFQRLANLFWSESKPQIAMAFVALIRASGAFISRDAVAGAAPVAVGYPASQARHRRSQRRAATAGRSRA